MGIRSVPLPWSELARADCTVPESPEEIALLAKAILHRKRDYPILVLTARRGETKPALAPVEVREIVGPGVPVYFVSNNFATYLAECLPARTQVWGGAARVYWPGVTSDPWVHPLLYDYNGIYGQEILGRLGKIFTRSVAREAELNPEQRILVLERELARVRSAKGRDLKVLRSRYEALLFNGDDSERPRQKPRIGLGSSRASRRDLEVEIRHLIEAHWAAYVPSRFKARHPLSNYTMTRGFLQDVTRRVGKVPIDRVAFVCALLACRFAPQGSGLSTGPMRTTPESPQAIRNGGETAWWCNLRRRSSPAQGPRLVYWRCRDGAPEFVAIGYPKAHA